MRALHVGEEIAAGEGPCSIEPSLHRIRYEAAHIFLLSGRYFLLHLGSNQNMDFKSPFLSRHISISPSTALFRHRLFFHSRRALHFHPLFPKQNAIIRMVVGERHSTGIFESAESLAASELPHMTPPAALVESVVSSVELGTARRMSERKSKRKAERMAYLFAAVASTVGITFLTAGAVYYRFAWQTEGTEIPLSEMFGTFSLAVGASVGMEFWARWAHRALWHDSLWSMHESHHRPRDGPFELNDVFAIINAVPAIALMAFGFFHKGLVPGLCFGAGLGITVFGIAYMFVHDGLVHRRFPVGPIADVPYLQKVAAAHQLHHADKFDGVPYGLFLGPKEVVSQVGGAEELEKMIQLRKKRANH